ncbi:MAG: sugar phosphate nucleotidyltransferase, partial [Deltaproteobacteria bacterium]
MINKTINTAFLLGAGLGLRLRPLTEHTPKPLLTIGDRHIISYAMEHLHGIGVNNFIVNTHHCPQIYATAFPHNSWCNLPMQFVHEPVLLDTGGGLKNIEGLLEAEENIFVYNAD